MVLYIIDQRSRDQRVGFGGVAEGRQGGRDGCVSLGGRFVGRQRRGDGGRNGGVSLGCAVAVAGDAQGQVFVLKADAEGRRRVQPPQSSGAHQLLEGGPARPLGGVLHGAGGQHRQLRQHRVNRALQAGFQGIQVGGAGEGPGALQGQDAGLCGVQPEVAQPQSGVQRGMALHPAPL